jgi:hypothetical protein
VYYIAYPNTTYSGEMGRDSGRDVDVEQTRYDSQGEVEWNFSRVREREYEPSSYDATCGELAAGTIHT